MGGNNNSLKTGEKGPRDATGLIYAASIFGVAFLLRLIYLFETSASPFFENLVIDCARYSGWAKEIAAGDWLGNRVFYQSPLYAYFLAVIYRFLTTDLFAVRIIQAVIGSGSCVLVYSITGRLFSRRVALLAGILAASFAPFIYYDGIIMKTGLSIFLAALGLYLLLKALDTGGPRTWLACGLTWGAAGLVRENYLLAAAVFAVWYFARYMTDRQLPLRPLWLYLAGLAIVILPVTVRNAAAGGEFALVTSQAGQNFYIGNNPSNRTGAYEVEDFVIANPDWEEKSFREFAQKETGREMTAGEVSAFYRSRALGWISDKPGPAFALAGKKFLLFFNNYEVADNQSIYFTERHSYLLRLNFLRFGLIAPLGILGLILLWRRRGELAPLYIFGIVYSATVIAFFIFGRYRLPVTLALLPPGAFAVFWIVEKLRARNWKALKKPAIVLACLFALVYLPVYRHHDELMAMQFLNLCQVHSRLGRNSQEQGEQGRALAQFRQALEACAEANKLLPEAAEPFLYAARALTQAGMHREAESEYLAAIEKAPSVAPIRAEFARFLFEKADAFFEAYEMLETALKLEPENPQTDELYRKVRAALRDREFYLEILQEKPDDIWALTYFGIASLLNRNREDSFVSIEKALELNPDYIPANNAMALFYLHLQNHDACEHYARRVLALGGTLWSVVRGELESCPHHHHNLEGNHREDR